MDNTFNLFTYTFSSACVPPAFARSTTGQIAEDSRLEQGIKHFWHWLNPYNIYDRGDRLARLIAYRRPEGQEDLFKKWIDVFHDVPGMRFMVLPVDFDYMAAGNPLMSYSTQLYELVRLKDKYPDRLLPFVAADPRRMQGARLVEFVSTYLDRYGFAGITITPAAGFYPFDPALYELYQFAQAQEVPIVTHCNTNGITYRGPITSQQAMPLDLSSHPQYDRAKAASPMNKPAYHPDRLTLAERIDIRKKFSAPEHFTQVLDQFPALKLCFADFVGEHAEWQKQVALLVDDKRLRVYASLPLADQPVYIPTDRQLVGTPPFAALWGDTAMYRQRLPGAPRHDYHGAYPERAFISAPAAAHTFLSRKPSTPQPL